MVGTLSLHSGGFGLGRSRMHGGRDEEIEEKLATTLRTLVEQRETMAARGSSEACVDRASHVR
jgi:hypothetical protein